MTEQHPITPPPELVQQWCYEDGDEIRTSPRWYQRVCAKAARWGADQELEACCKWLDFQKLAKHERMVSYLRAARRPKPPSLQDQALDDLERIAALLMEKKLPCDTGNIRRALERWSPC